MSPHSGSARVEWATRTQRRAAYHGEDSVVGCGMKPGFYKVWIALPLATALLSCSLPKKNNGGGGGGGGNATLSLTMIDTPPANSSILSFKATITGIALNPATGSSFSLPLTSSPFGTNPMIVELTRLQSDSAYLGTFTTVPAGTYSSVTVTLANARITFANQTGATIMVGTASCPTNSVCTVSGITPVQPSAISFGTSGLSLSTASPQGISLEFNLNNAITFTNGTLALDFSQAKAVTVATLPRTNSNLSTGQLDLIEDFTGVVTSVTQPSASSSGSVTLLSATRGTLAAKVPSGFIPDDPLALCGPTLDFTCIKQNQTASADAILNTDGTLTLQEIEPLFSTTQDLIEGVVTSISSSNNTQFNLVATDKVLSSSSSALNSLNLGDQVLVNLALPNPFLVDTKGLTVPVANRNLFAGSADTSVIFPGQSVLIQVSSFVAASGNVIAAATVNGPNTAVLRFSRFTASVASQVSSLIFTINNLPVYIPSGTPSNAAIPVFPSPPQVQTFLNATKFDGVSDATGLAINDRVSLRALFLENSAMSSTPAFFAAKVRKQQ